MKMILFNQNPMIAKLLESVSKKLELSIENFNHYQELSAHLKKDPEWLLIADDECLEKLDQVDWLELKEIISQNKNSVCMYKKGNEVQPFLEDFEVKIKKPFLPTEMLKVLQKKLGSDMSELEPNPTNPLEGAQETLETNWDELENLGDLEALAKEEPNNEEQLLPTLDAQEEKEEVKETPQEEKEEVKETPQEEKEEIKETPQEEKEEIKQEEKQEVKEKEKQEVKEKEKQEIKETPQEEKPKDDETQEGDETSKDEEVSKELETQEKLEIPKEETQEQEPIKEETQEQEPIKEETQEQEPIKEETQENKEEKQEETQDSPSAQELEAMQELVKEIQENSNEDKKETQESAEIPQDKEIQEVVTEKTQAQELEILKEKTQESAEALQETQEKETPQTQDEKPQEDHYESIEDIPEPVMAKAMGEELPFLNEAVAKTPNNENATETPKESVTETSKNENATETPQEKEESDKTSSPLELRLNLQDLLKSLNQESLKSLLENKTLSIKITLEDKKPNA